MWCYDNYQCSFPLLNNFRIDRRDKVEHSFPFHVLMHTDKMKTSKEWTQSNRCLVPKENQCLNFRKFLPSLPTEVSITFVSTLSGRCLQDSRNDDSLINVMKKGSKITNPAVWWRSCLSLGAERKPCESNAVAVTQRRRLVCSSLVTVGFCISSTERDPAVNSHQCPHVHSLANYL